MRIFSTGLFLWRSNHQPNPTHEQRKKTLLLLRLQSHQPEQNRSGAKKQPRQPMAIAVGGLLPLLQIQGGQETVKLSPANVESIHPEPKP
jgi:hypothetical protein